MKGFTQKDITDTSKKETYHHRHLDKGYHPFGIKGTFHHGAILPHRSQVNEIIEGHTQAYEISFNNI